MSDPFRPYYQRISDGVISRLPGGGWHRAWMDAIFYPDRVSFHGSYQETENGFCLGYGTARDAEKAFEEIREVYKQDGRIPWCRARFDMFATGKFTFQINYDNCDPSGFARYDAQAEKEWQERLLSGKPQPLFGSRQVPGNPT